MPAAAGSALAVSISGGTGLETSLIGGHSRYAYFGGTDPKPEFASLEIHSAGTATLRRSATRCNPQRLIDCAYVLIGTDSTGAQITLRLPVN